MSVCDPDGGMHELYRVFWPTKFAPHVPTDYDPRLQAGLFENKCPSTPTKCRRARRTMLQGAAASGPIPVLDRPARGLRPPSPLADFQRYRTLIRSQTNRRGCSPPITQIKPHIMCRRARHHRRLQSRWRGRGCTATSPTPSARITNRRADAARPYVMATRGRAARGGGVPPASGGTYWRVTGFSFPAIEAASRRARARLPPCRFADVRGARALADPRWDRPVD